MKTLAIVITHNDPIEAELAIQSHLEDGYDVVVWDLNSSGETISILEEYRDRVELVLTAHDWSDKVVDQAIELYWVGHDVILWSYPDKPPRTISAEDWFSSYAV